MIGLFAVTEAGSRAAAELAPFLGPDTVVPDGPVRPALQRLWPMLGSAVLFTGTESAVRLIAPLLRDKRSDPGVVCVDQEFVVSLAGGADALAARIADVLGLTAVLGSADEDGQSPLDELVELLDATPDGDLAACAAALQAGEPVLLLNPLGFPLPALPDTVLSHGDASWTIVIDDRLAKAQAERTLRLVPRTLVVGVGSGSGVSTSAVASALAELEVRGLDLRAVRAFATADRKAEERGILEALEDWGFWHDDTTAPLLTYSAEVLAEVDVPNPSTMAWFAAGTPSVAEAAALCGALESAAGGPVELAVEKVKGDNVTVAAARVLPRGRLAVIGLGPGAADQRTPQAEAELRRASLVVGSPECVAQVRHLLRPGTGIHTHGAVELAAAGLAVAWIGAGVGPDVPLSTARVETVSVPGVAAPG